MLAAIAAPGCATSAPIAPPAAAPAPAVYELSAGDGTIAVEAGFAAPRRLMYPQPYWHAGDLRRVKVALYRGAEGTPVQEATADEGDIARARFKFTNLGPNATYRVTVRGFADPQGLESIDACDTDASACETTITTTDDTVVGAPSLKLRLGMKEPA